ncbi:hypothetical protein P8610_16265, partial [Fictibacillus sp. UD]|uniref:hypothetical protein n=1 Tax=Fictibacillus sp. UD TaxID=3038777 RepID=UPI003745271D
RNTSAIREIRAPSEKYERHQRNTSAIREIRAPRLRPMINYKMANKKDGWETNQSFALAVFYFML